MHDNKSNYQMAYKLKNKYPTKALYYVSRVIGTKSFKRNVT